MGLHVMQADGSNQVRLANNVNFFFPPSWSSDGTKLAFSGPIAGNLEIQVVNINGSGLVNLTNNTSEDILPTWSPDGTKIAFITNRSGRREIYVMNSNGSSPIKISNFPQFSTYKWLQWSPTGNTLAFTTPNGIYRMNSDGTNLVQITSLVPDDDNQFNWNADGQQIIYRRDYTRFYVNAINGTVVGQWLDAPRTMAYSDFYWVGETPLANGRGLRGAYYAFNNLTGIRFFRLSNQINFNWAASSPEPNIRSQVAVIPVDNFSVRWTGFIEPLYTEAYTFFVNRNDGARLWVNGQQIINAWTNTTNAVETSSTAITLTAGVRVPITLEYYEATGNAQVSLSWQSARQTKQIVPSSALYPPEDSGSIPEVSP
jgi:hypothetical protein